MSDPGGTRLAGNGTISALDGLHGGAMVSPRENDPHGHGSRPEGAGSRRRRRIDRAATRKGRTSRYDRGWRRATTGDAATSTRSEERPAQRAYPGGAHVAEVEIDPDTGVIDILRYTAADDCGRVLNHTLLEGQLHGGIIQGIGQVVGEHCMYDAASGQLLTGSFMDYYMPRIGLLRDVRLYDHSVLSPSNPLGVKGAGEAGTTGAVPTLANAVLDALRPLGINQLDFPYTPARVWEAIQSAKSKA